MILYSFYKNIVLYLHQLYYAAYNNWTGQVLFERWTIGTYNMFFTSIPPIVIGLFERVCSDETRTANPQLYKATQVRVQTSFTNVETDKLVHFKLKNGTTIIVK